MAIPFFLPIIFSTFSQASTDFTSSVLSCVAGKRMGNSQAGSSLPKEESDKLTKHTHCKRIFHLIFFMNEKNDRAPHRLPFLLCTQVDHKELSAMYKQFKKETPQGAINKVEFKEVMKQMGVVDNFLQDLIFNVFDTDKDGSINFREFVFALSVMTRGTPDEKLECMCPPPPPTKLPLCFPPGIAGLVWKKSRRNTSPAYHHAAFPLPPAVAFQMFDIHGQGYITKEDVNKVLDSFYKLVGPLVTFSGRKYDSHEQLVEEFFEQMDLKGTGRITIKEYKEGAMKNPDIIQGLKLFS